MKTIKLPVHDIQVSLFDDGEGDIVCDPELYELCPHCSTKECCYECSDSQGGEPGEIGDKETVVASRLQFNGAVDGIMSMILAHACAGIDIESPEYLEGIKTAIEASANNI